MERERACLVSRHGRTQYLVTSAAIAIVYFGAAELGFRLALVQPQATPVWPPTGIALAALLLLGVRHWPAVALGALAANLTVQETLPVALCIAAGNTLEAVGGAWLLQRVAGFRNDLDRLRDVFSLVALAVVASPVLAATVGVTSLGLGGLMPWPEALPVWLTWWLGDALGVLVVAPLLLAWWEPRWLAGPPARAVEAGLLAVVTAVVSWRIFDSPGRAAAERPYLLFPLLIWAAVRFRQRGATAVTVVTSGLAIWGAMHGNSPFVAPALHDLLLQSQAYTAVVAITGLTLAAAISERHRIQAALLDTKQELEERVEQRTTELTTANERLRIELFERQVTEVRLRQLSTHDALTGLYNRGYFEEELRRLTAGRVFPISVLMADLDDLKSINDTLGHAAGDEMLRRAATALQASFRAEDVVARIGGDEFAVLLPGHDAAAADEALGRVTARLRADDATAGSPPLRVSLGIATATRSEDMDEALRLADARMYQGKDTRRRA